MRDVIFWMTLNVKIRHFQTTVLLSDINDFVAMNNVYKTFFSQREPARAAYQVSRTPDIQTTEILPVINSKVLILALDCLQC